MKDILIIDKKGGKMYSVTYRYDYVERKRINKGFEVNKIIKEVPVGTYETKQEALRHPNIKEEETYINGVYVILPIS